MSAIHAYKCKCGEILNLPQECQNCTARPALVEMGRQMFLVERGKDGVFEETVYATYDQGEAADFVGALPVSEFDYVVRRVPSWEIRFGDKVICSVDAYREMMNAKSS